jgi:pilus assembly protein TadC
MDKLKELNLQYFNRLKSNLNAVENEKNELLEDISIELSIKKRIRYSASFYFSFYFLGSSLLSHYYAHSIPIRLVLISFLVIPNVFFYNRKLGEVNQRIEERLLKHSMSNVIIVKDRALIDSFVKDYLNYYSTNKLI